MKNFELNEQCLTNLYEINNALTSVETKGDSTILIYKIRIMLNATLEQIQKDNQQEESKEETGGK